MKPAPFAYKAPETLSETLVLLREHGDEGKLLAGGQSLIPVMNFRLAQPAVLIDLNNVAGLADIWRDEAGHLHIGSMVRQRRLERDALVAECAPLITATMPYIAHPQIRNRGTIGGSLAHADPAGELPVLAVALEAQFRLQKEGSERWVDAEAFYEGLFQTALADDEILTEIKLPPLPAGSRFAFKELARRHGDYAQAGIAAVLQLDASGVCRAARLVFLNAGEIPMVASSAAAMLVGQRLTPELCAAAAAQAARDEIAPAGDVHASAEYKRHLAGVLAKRALLEAAGLNS
ncbi:MAG: xanthine dehydrogenase family protein subunit M [Ardenticatenales bacterium]|nr:xanthine dehydrogenase family protein subunit M [Ardenticatenales bacterium]